MTFDSKQIARFVQRPEAVFTRLGLWVGVVVSVVVGFSIGTLLELEDPADTTLLRMLSVCGLPVLFIATRFGSRAVYWRLGSRTKIGIADDVSRDLAGWAKARDHLSAMLKESSKEAHVSIKFIPAEVVRGPRKAAFARKYDFTAIAKIEGQGAVSLTAYGPDIERVVRIARDHKALPQVGENVRKLRFSGVSGSVGQSLHDGILYSAAIGLIARAYYAEAVAILQIVDRNLRVVDHRKTPRCEVRRLMEVAALVSAAWDYSKGQPSKEAWDEALELARRVEFLADESFVVANQLARLEFEDGNVDRAEKLVHKTEKFAETDECRAVYLVNRGFLACLNAQFKTAHNCLVKLFENDLYRQLNWADLVVFADNAVEVGHQHAIYPAALYRVLNGDRLPEKLNRDVRAWIEEDDSRTCLRHLLNRARRMKVR